MSRPEDPKTVEEEAPPQARTPTPMPVPDVPAGMARKVLPDGAQAGQQQIGIDDLLRTIGAQTVEIQVLRRQLAEYAAGIRDGLEQIAKLTTERG